MSGYWSEVNDASSDCIGFPDFVRHLDCIWSGSGPVLRPDWRPSTQVAEFEDMHLYRPKWFEIRNDRRHQKTMIHWYSMMSTVWLVNRSFLHVKIHGFSAWFFVYQSVGFAPGWYAKNFAWVAAPGCQGPRGFPLGKVMIDHDAKW